MPTVEAKATSGGGRGHAHGVGCDNAIDSGKCFSVDSISLCMIFRTSWFFLLPCLWKECRVELI